MYKKGDIVRPVRCSCARCSPEQSFEVGHWGADGVERARLTEDPTELPTYSGGKKCILFRFYTESVPGGSRMELYLHEVEPDCLGDMEPSGLEPISEFMR
jgi:hypothetical protein